jgi:outer membrane protein assembly factor BamA
VAATLALLPGSRHLLLFHGATGLIKNPVPGTEFDLGLGAGPRGFREHAFTGDRMYFGTAEYRYALANDFLKVVDVGLAGFVDVGGAWYRGNARRDGWDAGIGLRLGASRAPDLDANRIDLVYRSGNDRETSGWLLVVAKGFAFSSGLRGEQ